MAYQPSFSITAKLMARLEAIAALRERIASATVQVPWIPALQKDARARNAHGSTAIEGNPLTLEQVRAVEEGRPMHTTERPEREILNYFAGLRFVEKQQARREVTHDDILALHRLIATGVMDQGVAGRYRHVAVRVGGYLPPPANEVSGLMRELLDWWNHRSSEWSPVISSGILHYRFEAIHPFADGNGRMGRLLALWELYRRGFDTHHIFSIDEYYWEDHPRYYDELENVRQKAEDLTQWLEYVAQGMRLILEKVWLRIQRLAAENRGKKIALRPKQERLLNLLSDHRHQGLAPREIWKALGVSKQGAMDLLRPLIDAGLVKRVGTKKSGRYILG